MCGGFSYKHTDKITGEPIVRKVYFPIPHAEISVEEGEGAIRLVQWGRRKGEDEEFDIPVTGWARLDSIDAGKWKRYHPQQVRVPALSFMEKDTAKVSHWFEMKPETYLLGLEIVRDERSFVYIVTNPAQGPFKEIHDRWPVIIREDFTPIS